MEIVYANDYLAHYGILGQKWGVRRFQNLDGSLTSLGRIHYGVGQGRRKTNVDIQGATTSSKSHDKGNDYQKWKELGMTWATAIASTSLVVAMASSGRYSPKLVALAALADIGAVTMTASTISGSIKSASRKRKYEKEKASEPIDEKTGFHLKNKELSEEEDIKRVNPEYSNSSSNTKNNCALCTVSYELRRRGYDVSAKKASSGYTTDDLARWFNKPKTESSGSFDDFHKDYVKWVFDPYHTSRLYDINTCKKQADDTIKQLVAQGDGARGYLGINWNASPGSGHAIHYTVKGDKVQIEDAQTGKIYKEPHDILDRACYINYTRLDNLSLKEKKLSEVAE